MTTATQQRKLKRKRQVARFLSGRSCAWCGRQDRLTIDHKLARGLGGTDAMRNWQVLCEPCNWRKSREETRQALRERIIRACTHDGGEWCRLCRKQEAARTLKERFWIHLGACGISRAYEFVAEKGRGASSPCSEENRT